MNSFGDEMPTLGTGFYALVLKRAKRNDGENLSLLFRTEENGITYKMPY